MYSKQRDRLVMVITKKNECPLSGYSNRSSSYTVQAWDDRVKKFLKQRDSIPWHEILRGKLFMYICGWTFQKNLNM